MFGIGSAEIIIIVWIIFIVIPIAAAIYILFVVFHSQGRIEVLESRVAKLEKALDREARLDTLESRIDDMKK
jgi:flagellar basal body-associated protein FliL